MDISICIPVSGRMEQLKRSIVPLAASAALLPAGTGVELIIADFGGGDYSWLSSVWPYYAKIIRLPLPFSLGKGRNVSIADSSGSVIVVLDADMLVPVNFLPAMTEIAVKGVAAFPLYMRQHGKDLKELAKGAGWGNGIFSRANWNKVIGTFGIGYPESEVWGGEDTAFVNKVQELGIPIWRELLPGLIHQWHKKTGEWYGTKA